MLLNALFQSFLVSGGLVLESPQRADSATTAGSSSARRLLSSAVICAGVRTPPSKNAVRILSATRSCISGTFQIYWKMYCGLLLSKVLPAGQPCPSEGPRRLPRLPVLVVLAGS